jgi:hypothetical protein
MAAGVDVTRSSDEAGLEAARRSIGLVPGEVPAGAPPPVRWWYGSHDTAERAALIGGARIQEPDVSVLTLGVEAT